MPARAAWYERLLGAEPAFFPNETEAVWELAEHRYLYVERVESIGARGIEPASQETYENGVRKVIYRDPDGNEIGFGAPRSGDQPAWPPRTRSRGNALCKFSRGNSVPGLATAAIYPVRRRSDPSQKAARPPYWHRARERFDEGPYHD